MSSDGDAPGVAIVAGAAGAVGAAIVGALEAGGWTCVGFDATASPCVHSRILDIRDPESVNREIGAVADRFGEIECLVTATGDYQRMSIAEITPDFWQLMLRGHLEGTEHLARAVLPGMRTRKRGDIVTVISDVALGGTGLGAHHAAAAGAVLGFTKALASEVAEHGVQVNCVAGALLGDAGGSDPLAGVAATVRYLADETHFFAGQVLSPNGGRVI